MTPSQHHEANSHAAWDAISFANWEEGARSGKAASALHLGGGVVEPRRVLCKHGGVVMIQLGPEV